MAENGCAKSLSVKGRKEIELSKPDVVWQDLKRNRADRLTRAPDHEERLLIEVTLVEVTLKCLIPRPAVKDVRSHSCSLGLEGEVAGFGGPRQARKG